MVVVSAGADDRYADGGREEQQNGRDREGYMCVSAWREVEFWPGSVPFDCNPRLYDRVGAEHKSEPAAPCERGCLSIHPFLLPSSMLLTRTFCTLGEDSYRRALGPISTLDRVHGHSTKEPCEGVNEHRRRSQEQPSAPISAFFDFVRALHLWPLLIFGQSLNFSPELHDQKFQTLFLRRTATAPPLLHSSPPTQTHIT